MRAGFKKYNLYAIRGTVTTPGKTPVPVLHIEHADQKLSNQNKKRIPVVVTVQSTSAIYNRLFIADHKGCQHALQLSDFDIVCKEGDELVAVWAIKKGNTRGPFIALKNISAGQSFFSNRQLMNMFQPPLALLFLAGCGGFAAGAFAGNYITGLLCGAALALLAWIMAKYIAAARANQFKASFDFKV